MGKRTRIDLDFVVEHEDGGLSASCAAKGIFTQGRDKEDLARNIEDAVRLHFEDLDFGDSAECRFCIRMLFVSEEKSLLVHAA